MQYALLIYGPDLDKMPTDPSGIMAEYDTFTRHLAERGAMRAGEALLPVATATTVRVRDGQVLTTDGPFAETKEVLGGFYIVEAADLDEAVAYAARIPGAKGGSIEVRPVADMGDHSTQAVAAAVTGG